MQIEAEVSQEGVLTVRVPDRYRGRYVRISIEDRVSQSSPQWRALSAMIDKVDVVDVPRRSHREILDALHDFRESR
ncbi:hypothetical protein Thiosp_04838 [Thiorhodovibrio litoralis]|nr:hypothetical protein Thiosp_04838 [Thiorhodovibrio litoralis]